MLTLFKKIFIWWNQETLETKLKLFLQESLLEVTYMEINTMRIEKERDGSFTAVRLMPQKYLMSGIHGFILQTTR